MTTDAPPLLWPVPGHTRVSSGFDDPRGYGPHNAIDIPAPDGAPVVSPAPGAVIFTGDAGDCGTTIQLALPASWRAHYCHLAETFVRNGNTTGTGGAIGTVGTSGVTTGPHLHFNLFAPDQLPGSRYVPWLRLWAVDPLTYLRKETTVPEDPRITALEKRKVYLAHVAQLLSAAHLLADAGRVTTATTRIAAIHDRLDALTADIETERALP